MGIRVYAERLQSADLLNGVGKRLSALPLLQVQGRLWGCDVPLSRRRVRFLARREVNLDGQDHAPDTWSSAVGVAIVGKATEGTAWRLSAINAILAFMSLV
ncbi:hypothetical protein SASPL_151424 [Salvia splendens]|uniref:Uncharacterized protein n=1 Tax=Salvia splendens TaxID=180675 RepID=A0A8X8W986_SALSN|nr:hypothetical protein SASPL_151424 [Salvia splendens]